MDLASGTVRGGLALLGLGLALGVAGVVLIWYGARMTRKAVARRVNLVREMVGRARVRALPAEKAFIRHETRGLSVQQQQGAIRLFSRFGVPASHAPEALLVLRLVSVGILALLVYFTIGKSSLFASSGFLQLLVSLGFGLAGWFVPMMVIGWQIKRRIKAVVLGLPDALELLVICVEAGLAFEDGIDRIVRELEQSQPALANELSLTSADLKILSSRDVALANLAERVDMPSIRSVVTTLTQTMRYGTPLAHALRAVASELRNDSLMQLEERANQLPTLMTIPMMIFIMPTIFMIVGGPAVLRVLDSFHN
jgi:tight adherence protein C